MLNESNIIHYLQQQFPSPEGIGDDAAVFPLSDTESYVITKDLLVEDVHFRRRYYDAESLAHKALHVNLSDLAAMGAGASYALLGIAIPKDTETYTDSFLERFAEACQAYDVALIGGDTVASPGPLSISVTLIGKILTTNLKFRHRARPGDIICIAGNLGYSYIGFKALEKNIEGLDEFKGAFLKPTALLKEGIWFGAQPGIGAMMDISDGFYVDLTRLCQASHVKGEVDLDALPTNQDFNSACQELHLDPLQAQLSGGEDYGLLVTVHPDEYANIEAQFTKQFGYALQKIGTVKTGSDGVIWMKKGQQVELDLKPFCHFGELE